MIDPLHQFEVKTLIPLSIKGIDISFTNSSLYMILAMAVVSCFFIAAMYRETLIPSRLQASAELLYQFVASTAYDILGTHTKRYFPFILAIFTFVLFGNLIGLIPYAYTVTSQLVITAILSFLVFFAVLWIGFSHHGKQFFTLFFPKGAPPLLAPLLIPIEIISFIARPVSLALRLFVNMVAGHCILKIFASFTIMAGLFGAFPLTFNVLFIAFEILVAFIQAYIFCILTCIYLNDALELH